MQSLKTRRRRRRSCSRRAHRPTTTENRFPATSLCPASDRLYTDQRSLVPVDPEYARIRHARVTRIPGLYFAPPGMTTEKHRHPGHRTSTCCASRSIRRAKVSYLQISDAAFDITRGWRRDRARLTHEARGLFYVRRYNSPQLRPGTQRRRRCANPAPPGGSTTGRSARDRRSVGRRRPDGPPRRAGTVRVAGTAR